MYTLKTTKLGKINYFRFSLNYNKVYFKDNFNHNFNIYLKFKVLWVYVTRDYDLSLRPEYYVHAQNFFLDFPKMFIKCLNSCAVLS